MSCICFQVAGVIGSGAATEGGGDRDASDGATDAGDGEGAPVTGRRQTCGHSAAPSEAQRISKPQNDLNISFTTVYLQCSSESLEHKNNSPKRS